MLLRSGGTIGAHEANPPKFTVAHSDVTLSPAANVHQVGRLSDSRSIWHSDAFDAWECQQMSPPDFLRLGRLESTRNHFLPQPFAAEREALAPPRHQARAHPLNASMRPISTAAA